MTDTNPRAELHVAFSDPRAAATSWDQTRSVMERAEVFWVSTVRPDGRPHVTPLVAVWLDGSLYFCTGPDEIKARNLARNPQCILTTGCKNFQRKYDFWNFEVRDGAFHHEAGRALVFELAPKMAFAHGRGELYSATRYRF